METRKIIGYKLKNLKYRRAAKEIAPFSKYLSSDDLISNSGYNYISLNVPNDIDLLKEAGVGVGKILKGIFTLDYDAITAGWDQLTGSWNKAVTDFKSSMERPLTTSVLVEVRIPVAKASFDFCTSRILEENTIILKFYVSWKFKIFLDYTVPFFNSALSNNTMNMDIFFLTDTVNAIMSLLLQLRVPM